MYARRVVILLRVTSMNGTSSNPIIDELDASFKGGRGGGSGGRSRVKISGGGTTSHAAIRIGGLDRFVLAGSLGAMVAFMFIIMA